MNMSEEKAKWISPSNRKPEMQGLDFPALYIKADGSRGVLYTGTLSSDVVWWMPVSQLLWTIPWPDPPKPNQAEEDRLALRDIWNRYHEVGEENLISDYGPRVLKWEREQIRELLKGEVYELDSDPEQVRLPESVFQRLAKRIGFYDLR